MIIIVALSVIFIYYTYSIQNYLFSPEYHSIQDFESLSGVKIYMRRDCVQFIEDNHQVLLQDVSNELLLSTYGIENKNEMTYDIIVGKQCFYRVYIN